MGEPAAIEIAAKRLNAALEALEASLGKHKFMEKTIGALEDELQAQSEDRSRLAQEIDRLGEHARRLEKVNSRAGEQLNKAIDVIDDILSRNS